MPTIIDKKLLDFVRMRKQLAGVSRARVVSRKTDRQIHHGIKLSNLSGDRNGG